MAFNSSIEWTESTWNPITGRMKVSLGYPPQMSVSVENKDYTYRINHLRYTHAILVGGESIPKARPMKLEWVVTIRDECRKAKVPFFFKQWGGVNKKKNGRVLEGRIWEEMPKLIKVV